MPGGVSNVRILIFKTMQDASALKKLLNGPQTATLEVSSLTTSFADAILAVPDVCSCLQQQTLAPETLRSKDNELLSIIADECHHNKSDQATPSSLVPTPILNLGTR